MLSIINLHIVWHVHCELPFSLDKFSVREEPTYHCTACDGIIPYTTSDFHRQLEEERTSYKKECPNGFVNIDYFPMKLATAWVYRCIVCDQHKSISEAKQHLDDHMATLNDIHIHDGCCSLCGFPLVEAQLKRHVRDHAKFDFDTMVSLFKTSLQTPWFICTRCHETIPYEHHTEHHTCSR